MAPTSASAKKFGEDIEMNLFYLFFLQLGVLFSIQMNQRNAKHSVKLGMRGIWEIEVFGPITLIYDYMISIFTLKQRWNYMTVE